MMLRTLLFVPAICLSMYSALAQTDPGCGDPTVCCTCRLWTLSGPSQPAANTTVVYTATPGPDPNGHSYVKNYTAQLSITASTLLKVSVDGVTQMFNPGTTKVFQKSVSICTPENSASVSWNLSFLQPGRYGVISLLDKSSCHDSDGYIDFVTQ